jgi:hypothetical protein
MRDLTAWPPILRRMLESFPVEALTQRPAAGGFAMIEHAWHLADLEVEGYGVCLRRLLDETNPALSDFRGDIVAEERAYIRLPLAPALDRFEHARNENAALIASASEEQRRREGVQEGVRIVTFARVAEMMDEHDREHAIELLSLVAELGV